MVEINVQVRDPHTLFMGQEDSGGTFRELEIYLDPKKVEGANVHNIADLLEGAFGRFGDVADRYDSGSGWLAGVDELSADRGPDEGGA